MALFEYVFRPVISWPRSETPAHKRKPSQFSATYEQTMGLLERELQYAGAKGQVVIQAFVKESDLRLDGRLRSDSRPEKPGVILNFTGIHGPLQYPCDSFTHWKDNMRAIALALEALRKVDRYGVTTKGEQYTGWKALPPAASDEVAAEKAADFIAQHCRFYMAAEILGSGEVLDAAYKTAAQKLHPDKGGSHDLFVRLNEAATVLRKRQEAVR